jgi:Tfp pilus assembly protein PilN
MINLLPDTIKEERRYGRRNRLLLGYGSSLVATAAIVASIMMLSLGFVGTNQSDLEAEIVTLQDSNLRLEKDQAVITNLVKDLDTVNKIYEGSVNFSELIPQIAALMPKGVVLNALSLTGGKTDPIQLDVDLADQNLTATLVQNLITSELFEAADISSIIAKGSEDAVIYKFGATVSVSFKGSAEAKRKEKEAEEAKAKAAEEAAAQAGSENASGGAQ